jgi:Na+-translocating ferredoxin:NAD+ oxidoreductase RnfG subunit
MQWIPSTICVATSLMGLCPVNIVMAKQYLTMNEVKQVMFGGEILHPVILKIPELVHEKMRKESGVRHPFLGNRIWKTTQGAWLIVDEVVGKHEMITYALGVLPDGTIKGVEILQYNESYGGQIREKKWLQQFEGKSSASQLRLNQDIVNMTGATLSSKHVTDGVRRLMTLYREYLSKDIS